MAINLQEMICQYSCDEEKLKYFKQTNIYDNCIINCSNIEGRSVEVINTKLNILSGKIINTNVGTSIEGQTLTGKKLVLLGEAITKIKFKCSFQEHKYLDCKKANHYMEKSIPFSTFIILPNPLDNEKDISLRYFIEDTTAIMITRNKLFISVTTLIEYLDEYVSQE